MTRIGSVILLELGIGVLDEDGKNVFSKKFNNPAHAYGLLRGATASRRNRRYNK